MIVGDGPERNQLEALTERLGLTGHVSFVGACWGKNLIDLYANARAVYYAPYDEDYGLVVPEAFRAYKPVITTTDAGGPLEFVTDGETGCVSEPDPDPLADAINQLVSCTEDCCRMGMAGYERVKFISWDNVIENLVG